MSYRLKKFKSRDNGTEYLDSDGPLFGVNLSSIKKHLEDNFVPFHAGSGIVRLEVHKALTGKIWSYPDA